METKFKFNSQVCTSRSQSERLLALGLKKETADMYYRFYDENTYEINPTWETIWEDRSDYKKIIPAWSLGRLVEMIQEVCPQVILIRHRVDIRSNVKRIAYSFDACDNLYDNIIDCIEWLIYNKKYLEK